MKKRILLSVPAALAALGLATVPAMAQQHAKFTLAESGGNVVGTWSGAFDVAQFGSSSVFSDSGFVTNLGYALVFSAGSTTYALQYQWVPTYNLGASTGLESSIFSGGLAPQYASSDSGGFVGVIVGAGNYIGVEPTVTTGTPLTSSSTWNATTLAGLNLNPGTYVWNYGANNSSVTLQVGAASAAVPEPGEWAAMGILGAGLAGLVLRKRKQA